MQAFIHDLKTLRIQGAKQIAIQSLLFLEAYDPTFGRAFKRAAAEIERTRPTAVVLHNCLKIIEKKPAASTVRWLIKKLQISRELIAKNGTKLVKSGSVIMTHCHSGEALSIIEAASRAGKRVSVIATITEPARQGIRTAKELRDAGIPVTLIGDSAVGHFMPDVDFVLTGSDAMRREGNVNKIGTLVLALTAAAHGKPYYVAADTLKLDRRKKLVIEERPASEVLRPIKGVEVRNPAFDVTPWRYVKAVVTEGGIKTPKEIVKLIRRG